MTGCLKDRIDKRYLIAILCFFGLANAYIMRFCLSIALTKMIVANNVMNFTRQSINEFDYCPTNNDTNSEGTSSDETGAGAGEFEWSEAAQKAIESAFFWGYLLSQVPGGLLAERIGGKHTLSVGILISTLGTLLTPLAAREGDVLGLIEVRIIMGIGQGLLYPSLNVILANWAPTEERGRLGAIVFSGANFGSVVALGLSGLILSWCDGSWPSLFYVYGLMGLLWLMVWCRVGHNSPNDDPTLTDRERLHLQKYHEEAKLQQMTVIPWGSILTCIPLWGLIVSQIGHDWGLFVMNTDLPRYMKNVMHFTIAQNGLLSAIPHLLMWLTAIASGWWVDWILINKIYSVSATRKIFTTVSSIGPALGIIGAAYAGCNRFVVVSLIAIGMSFMGCFYPSLKVNPLDLSPNYAGTLMALVNGIGAISGVFIPYINGLFVTDNTLNQWQVVFLLSAFILIVTNVFYLITGSAEIQPWNDPRYTEKLEEIRYDKYKNSVNGLPTGFLNPMSAAS